MNVKLLLQKDYDVCRCDRGVGGFFIPLCERIDSYSFPIGRLRLTFLGLKRELPWCGLVMKLRRRRVNPICMHFALVASLKKMAIAPLHRADRENILEGFDSCS